MSDHLPDRRSFLKTSAGALAGGGMLALGFDLRAAQHEVRQSRFAHVREVPSVCPYCAVGCSQLVSVPFMLTLVAPSEKNQRVTRQKS